MLVSHGKMSLSGLGCKDQPAIAVQAFGADHQCSSETKMRRSSASYSTHAESLMA